MSDYQHQNAADDDNAAQLYALIGSLAPGFRFMPNDRELFFFLQQKLLLRNVEEGQRGRDYYNYYIKEFDVYKHPLHHIQRMFPPNGANNREWYFFVPRTIKFENGSITNRTVFVEDEKEIGHWKMSRRGKSDYPLQENEKMQKLVYMSGARPNSVKTDWHMMEYRIKPPEGQEHQFVLCKIYYSSKAVDVVADDDDDDFIDNNYDRPLQLQLMEYGARVQPQQPVNESSRFNHQEEAAGGLMNEYSGLENPVNMIQNGPTTGHDNVCNNLGLENPVNGPIGPEYEWPNNLGLEQIPGEAFDPSIFFL